jgi:hypothetical protein
MDVEVGVGERGGDAGELIGFIFGEDGEESDGLHRGRRGRGGVEGQRTTPVDDAFGFAFADGERAGGDQLDFGFGEDFGAEFVGEAGFELDEVFDVAVEVGGGEFDFDGHGVEAIEFDEVIAAELGVAMRMRSICWG